MCDAGEPEPGEERSLRPLLPLNPLRHAGLSVGMGDQVYGI